MDTKVNSKSFPAPSSLQVVKGTERAQEAYPYYMQFTQEDDARFWFYNSMHFPEPMSAFDVTTAEAAYCALGAANTRVHSLPTTLGIDYRIINGRIYIGGNSVSDPAEIERRTEQFQQRAFSAIWDSAPVPVKARAVARGMWVPINNGIIVLDPTSSGSLSSNGGSNVTTNAKIIVDSSSPSATTVTGGGRHGDTGYFVEPTVITNTRPDMKIVREEIFGPVVVAEPFRSLDEIAAEANNTSYGLGAGIWTKDISKAHALAKKLRAGTVWINCYNVFDASLPFGGYKQSGWGREMGHEVLEAYTEVKAVTAQL